MKSLKRISKIQTKIKTVLTQMISVGVVALILLFLIEAPASGFSGSGAGTPANPYQITNATQLQEMQDDLNAHYVLANDIDCSGTVNWNGGAGFEPVGYDQSHPFTATFNGQGYVITGLYINRPSKLFVGLFSFIANTSTIKNVGLVDVNITGNLVTGGLVAYNQGNITNCYVTGSVEGLAEVGGLVGQNFINGNITNSYSTASVSATGYEYWTWPPEGPLTVASAGGLVGVNYMSSTIKNCYATGNITGQYLGTGGLVGWNARGTITNSYATGNVDGTDGVGGLVGWNGWDDSSIITNSYATGSVSGSTNVGGLVGWCSYGTISNSHYTDTANQNGNGIYEPGGASAFYGSTHTVYDQGGANKWDFVNVWGICEGCSYPYLLWQPPIVDTTPPEITCPADVTVEQESYDGTVVTLEATATDICDPNPVITSDELAIYPLGVTIVTFTATDASGNSASCSMSVTVVDTTPPAINSISASPDVLCPPNHKMVEVTVTVECEDICDPVPFCCIVAVTSNEPINGPGDGNTEPDWELFDDEPLVALLRAERAGGGTGRIYTIIVECMDASGNTATATVDVTVPHDQGKGKGKK